MLTVIREVVNKPHRYEDLYSCDYNMCQNPHNKAVLNSQPFTFITYNLFYNMFYNYQ